MIEFAGHGILLDVEGTTSSIRFVYDVMFPYARRELDGYLRDHWGEPGLVHACEQLAHAAGHPSLEGWLNAAGADPRLVVRDEALRLMDDDAKVTGLKTLQGLVWRDGFERGEMRAHLYDDVKPALEAWKRSRQSVRIYSSGSVAAQMLFFGHTAQGNLLGLLDGHYDTTTGPKREAASYVAIAKDYGLAPEDILFLSDVVAELDAAHGAGLATGLCVRKGNAPVEPGHHHAEVSSFDEVALIAT